MASDDGPEFAHDVERAVVTGATGNVGSWVVDRLAEQGVEVVGVDLDRPDHEPPNAAFRAVDLRDHGETWETIHEADPDAVVHFAAIPHPLDDPGTRVFDTNVASTYNVLVAAGRADADVVWTSSQAAYGFLYTDEPRLPDYLPVDEAHPLRPADPYGTSKVCGEEVAASVARRHGVSVTSVRPVTVYGPGEYRARPLKEGYDLENEALSGNFWSYVDVRDVARMVEAALAADHGGHEAVLCVADENYLGHPTADLIRAAAGELPADCALEGEQAAFSNAKAADLLDWRPVHGWREEAPGSAPELDWL